jgi:serine/threonine-protein kinase
MAPEQLASQPIDRRVDVYAAGCMLWEMLTLRRLFQGDDEAQLLAGVLQGAKQPPSALRPDVPAGIDFVCMQALGAAETRFPSAAAFAEALEDAARHEGVRLASLRDVGRFVRELAPSPAEPVAPPEPPPSGLPAGMVTPQRWQATPPPFMGGAMPLPGQRTPISSVSPGGTPPPSMGGAPPASAYPTSGGGGGGLIPGTRTPIAPTMVFDTNPSTNASMVATPAPSPITRQRALITIVAALGVATLGGVIAYIVTGPPPSQAGTPSATTTGTEPTTAPGTTTSPDSDTEPATTAPATTTSSSATSSPGGRPLPKPKPKGSTETKTQPPPTSTATEWRPAKP